MEINMLSNTEKYKVAIIGSGPAGLSAAGRAAELGVSHILLEGTGEISNTINFWYQKGKHVMNEPAQMPLRSSVGFKEGTREEILEEWQDAILKLKINIKFNATLKSIEGDVGAFLIKLSSGEEIQAATVILAIGTMGNIRKLGIPGEENPIVNYKLDDASLIKNKHITLIGAGDSAIEDALALSKQNKVTIINRRNSFDRAKGRNSSAILRAIQNQEIECVYEGVPAAINAGLGDELSFAAELVVESPVGNVSILTDKIIIRAGAMPQRRLLDSLGVGFPNQDETAFPLIGEGYQSTRAGLYVVGALAGCPLIKEAMNQGYEVIEFIEGRHIDPADQELVQKVLSDLPGFTSVKEELDKIKSNLGLMKDVSMLNLREFIRAGKIKFYKKGEVLHKPGYYSDVISVVLSGRVLLSNRSYYASEAEIAFSPQQVLGTQSLFAGLAWSGYVIAIEDVVLLETPFGTARKILSSIESLKEVINHIFTRRVIFSAVINVLPLDKIQETVNEMDFDELAYSTSIQKLKAGQVIYEENSDADCLYLVRTGTVSISRIINGKSQVEHLVSPGQWFGVDEILMNSSRLRMASATRSAELVKIDGGLFRAALSQFPSIEKATEKHIRKMLLNGHKRNMDDTASQVMSFFHESNIVDGTNVLIINESICVGCDNCEKACAETHGGVSRLNRKEGDSFASIHIASACRHCYEPGCMTDCPPDAISRKEDGSILINADTCIGCGNCVANCPFEVVKLVAAEPQQPFSLFSWLALGKGRAPGQEVGHHDPKAKKVAVKCDLCANQSSGPACVQSCPTGAAVRGSPINLLNLFERRSEDRRGS
jgi:thioredoxin reductase/Fe-S-cluster-containing hydrogenase component 2/CRP-like cAMP-binding protein